MHLTDEDVYMSVSGTSQDAAVRLDKSSLDIEDTYISLANQRTVTISNRSDVIVHFRWTRFATSADEERQKITYVTDVKCSTIMVKFRWNGLEQHSATCVWLSTT